MELDPPTHEAFFALHHGLPREAPGGREHTARALALAQPLPASPRVLDLGCGPGAQTIDLAELLPQASIVAVDLHPGFVEEVGRRAAARGVADRVRAEVADMAALPFEPASFDLLWCEGAAYALGVEAALEAWRPLLRHDGRIALTEAVWLCDAPPEDLRRFWREGYPAMTDVPGVRAWFRSAGLQLRGDFVLPASAWWDDYYGPLRARMKALALERPDDAALAGVLAAHREELEMFERHGDRYGYAFFVASRS
ncbi:SAM-dependent methyltransferase [Paraliomyxa miuraensis]|uniref:SAM-dependent methyltransferase n=1 Tax=Paraliomyxa miuraensis TaxID=376150 RepID=UPI002257227D|nr:class I SAM-dependent methyltransferase [Paraliomyxa miuraensis]MCX4247548.1 class I SAM-dependent methyltransferase [Paraliomyxa miuraensis]